MKTAYNKYFKKHNAILSTLQELKQMLNQTNKHPHKHAEFIKAWADGAEIQIKNDDNWFDTPNPKWNTNYEYRVKPELSDIHNYDIEVGDIWFINDSYLFVLGVNKINNMEDGWAVRFNRGLTTSKQHLVRIGAKLLFRRGVIDYLNEL